MRGSRRAEPFVRAIRKWQRDRIRLLAAGLSFFAILSFCPILLGVLLLLVLLLGTGPAQDLLIGGISSLAGQEGFEAILWISSRLTSFRWGFWGIVLTLVTVLFGATQLGVLMRVALDEIFGKEPTRKKKTVNWFYDRVLSLGIVFFLGGVLVVFPMVSAVVEALSRLLGFLSGVLLFVGLRVNIPWLWILDEGVAFVFVWLASALSYRFFPRKRIGWRKALSGAAIAAACFLVGREIFAKLVERSLFASLYGFLGSFILAMFWVYFAFEIFLLGAEFAEVLDFGEGKRGCAHRAREREE